LDWTWYGFNYLFVLKEASDFSEEFYDVATFDKMFLYIVAD